ncbi:MAG TPA: class I adenylate-forming enzyme family protein [Solirubrobacterales bacterium]|nr:class I adenylate-forming enzyme family protein [Solirubrobacterales bacterium]
MATTARAAESGPSLKSAETVYSALAEAGRAEPGRTFLRDGSERTTYGALLAESDAVAARLAGLGVGAGDRVVLWLPNGLPWAASFFACARLGAVAVMAGTRLRAVDLHHILENSGASTLVFSPRFLGIDYDAMVEAILRERVSSRPAKLRHLLATAPSTVPGATRLERLPEGAPPPPFDDDRAPAVVCYTSGTTGLPKGCVHSHRGLVRNAAIAARLTGLTRWDRVLCPVPFAHVFGFHMGVLQSTLSRATLVNGEPYDAERLLDLAESEAATVLYAVPAMAHEVVALQARSPRDLSALRTTLVAGAPVSAKLRRAVMAADGGLGSAISVVYGCTEAPTLTQVLPGAPLSQRLATVGNPTPGVELRICREGTEEALPSGETGEILSRGYNRMLGYLDDREATTARMRGEWFVTGDLGWVDGWGFLHFVGRASEMFTVGGFNAYPREIEAQLEEMDGLVMAAITGVPDARLGSVPMAWVTVEDPALGEQEILAWARDHLASYKRPRHVRVVGTLPRTPSGKLSRVKLERLARRALPSLDWEAER